MNIFLKLALLIAFGVVGGKVARKLNLPNVTGYILAGLLLGPSFFNVISEQEAGAINFVNEFALGIIAFTIGAEFAWPDLKRMGKDIIIITVMEVLGVVAVVFTIMYVVLGQSFVFSLIIASMSAATAPAGTVMVIQQFRAYGPLTKSILAVAALDDALGIMVFSISLSIAKLSLGASDIGFLTMIGSPLLEIGGSLLLGGIIGLVFSFIYKRIKSQEDLLEGIILTILGTTGLALLLNLSPLLANMMVGCAVVNIVRNPKRIFDQINEFAPPFNLLFFAFAGAGLDLSILAGIGGLGIVYVISRALGKISGATLGAKMVKSKDTIVKYLGIALLPQGGVSIGLSMIVARELPTFSSEIITVILFSVLIFEISGPILSKIAITKAGEVNGLDRIGEIDATEETQDEATGNDNVSLSEAELVEINTVNSEQEEV